MMLTEPIMQMSPLWSCRSHFALIYLVAFAIVALLTGPRQQKST